MNRLKASVRLFFQGLRIFYGCEGSVWLKVLGTPVILGLCLAVALLNLSDNEEPGGGT